MPLYFNAPSPYWNSPSDRSYLAESYPGDMSNNPSTPGTAGRIEFVRLKLLRPASITNIVMAVQAAGNTLTAGQCFAALYTSASVRVGVTADQAASWVSTGIKTMALASGPFSCAAGEYYVAFWYNGTTSPAWHRSSNITGSTVNAGRSSPNFICGTADTGLTTTSPDPMGSQTTATVMWWAALS